MPATPTDAVGRSRSHGVGSHGVGSHGVGSHGVGSHGVVPVLAFAGIVVSLMQTLVIPLLPALPRLLHASPSNTTWAITATLLAGAVATPVVGRLGDMYGKRRMLLVSVVLLIAGSAVGGLSDSLARWLSAARCRVWRRA
jgi:MFS family permease